jgi:hypothetical protein
MSLKKLLIAVAALAALALAGPGQASASHWCHAQFYNPHGPYTTRNFSPLDAVSINHSVHLSCSRALHIAARARNTPHLRMIFDPSRFGPGGFGGPFTLGSYQCYLNTRGSDFIVAECWRGSEHVWFNDHRDYMPYLDPGFHLPALRP